MSFFKKLLQQEELTVEQKAERELERIEKARINKEKYEQYQIEAEARKIEKAEKKEAKALARQQDLERFFGTSPGTNEKNNYNIYTFALDRVRDKLISFNENVIASCPAEYDMPGGKEVKGLLIATNQKLIFSSNTITKEYIEVMDYKTMGSISIKNDGFLKKELHVVSGREKRVFDDLRDDAHLQRLLDGVRNQIATAHSGNSNPTKEVASPISKAQQLKEFAELRDSGILSEEEFQAEKAKILNLK